MVAIYYEVDVGGLARPELDCLQRHTIKKRPKIDA